MNNITFITTILSYGKMSTVPKSEQNVVENDTASKEGNSQQSFVQYDISDILMKVFPPIILLFGTFGNVMTMLLMRMLRRRSGDPSICVYFACLAVCDQVALTLGLGRKWIKSVFLYDVRTLHVVVCKLHKFLVFAVSRIATWILVALTSQRVITIFGPRSHRLLAHWTKKEVNKRAEVVVLIIVGLCCLYDSGILIVYYLQKVNGKTKCKPLKYSPLAAFYVDNIVWMNILTASWLPFVILFINNFILGKKILQSVKASHQLMSTEQVDARTKQATSLSITLIVTSFTFILLTSAIPVTILINKFPPSSQSPARLKADLELVETVFVLLLYSNSAVNFYLYVLTSRNFRRHASSLLNLKPPKDHRSNATDFTTKPDQAMIVHTVSKAVIHDSFVSASMTDDFPVSSIVMSDCPESSPVIPDCPESSPVIPDCPVSSPVISDRPVSVPVSSPAISECSDSGSEKAKNTVSLPNLIEQLLSSLAESAR